MQEHNYSIKQWAKDDRPREKLLTKGAENLSNSELLAILIHNGTRKKSALELAKELLKLGNDDLGELAKLSIHDFTKIKGIGDAKAVTLTAALELGRRRQSAGLLEKPVVQTSRDVAGYLHAMLRDHQHEVFAVLYLNRANKVLGMEVVSEGGVTGTIADPRIIIKKALEKNATSLVLCHNHPSGSLKPSRADEALTKKIKEAAWLFDIKVIDHIIVSESGFFSFSDEGLL